MGRARGSKTADKEYVTVYTGTENMETQSVAFLYSDFYSTLTIL
jgi:hypothetical protein